MLSETIIIIGVETEIQMKHQSLVLNVEKYQKGKYILSNKLVLLNRKHNIQ
jgi:hypothetical protein